jgi:hypothetical protein
MVLSVTFTPTPADALEAAHALKPGRWGRYERLRYVAAGAVLALLGFVVIASYDWKVWDLYILNLEQAAVFAFAGAFAGWYYGRIRPPMAAGDPRLQPRTVTVADAGFTVAGEGFETRVAWSAVSRFVERNGGLLFVTHWQDIHFVPRSAFASDTAAASFAKAAQNAWLASWKGATAGAA